MTTFFRPWVQSAIAVLTALVAMGWCAPSRALATCGDYVMSGHGATEPHESAPLPVFDASSRPLDHEALPPLLGSAFTARTLAKPAPCRQCPTSPGDAPCEGPWCSGSHQPMPVPPTTVDNVQDHWACWRSTTARDTGMQVGLRMPNDRLDRVHHVFPIFHPPRPI